MCISYFIEGTCDFERKWGVGASFVCLFTACVLESRDGAGDEEAGPNMQTTPSCRAENHLFQISKNSTKGKIEKNLEWESSTETEPKETPDPEMIQTTKTETEKAGKTRQPRPEHEETSETTMMRPTSTEQTHPWEKHKTTTQNPPWRKQRPNAGKGGQGLFVPECREAQLTTVKGTAEVSKSGVTKKEGKQKHKVMHRKYKETALSK